MPISMAAFTACFALTARDIVLAKEARFTKYLSEAVNGKLFARPKVKPLWLPRMQWEPPIPGKTQTSYDDVEYELNAMRNKNLDKFILLVGGDGLSIHRMWWLLHNKPYLYVDSAPLIIPIQGESPHGVFHVMHAGWRMYIRFIRWCAEALNRPEKAIKDDPLVSDFNSHFFFLQILTRACAEFMTELLRDGPGIDRPDAAMQEADRSPALAWVFHFLYDFAFMVHEFKQGVRASDAPTLDRLWREFFSLGHCGTANKNLYVPMAIMRVWASKATAPPIRRLMDRTRSIPLSDREGAMTGWDMPCEHLNSYITASVTDHVSPESIETAVHRYAIFSHNHALIAPTSSEHMMKEFEDDVEELKKQLRRAMGTSWRAACAKQGRPPWAQAQNQRGMAPWLEVQQTMSKGGRDAVGAFIARKVRDLTSSYYTFNL